MLLVRGFLVKTICYYYEEFQKIFLEYIYSNIYFMLLLFLFEKTIILLLSAALFKNVAFEKLERDDYPNKYIPPP